MAEEEIEDPQAKDDADESVAAGLYRGPLPLCQESLEIARTLIFLRRTRMQDIVAAVAEDPVFTMEVLRRTNSLFVSQYRQPTTNLLGALVRLGLDPLRQLIDELRDRAPLKEEPVRLMFESMRMRLAMQGKVALAIGEMVMPAIAGEAQLAGMLQHTGLLLACAKYQMRFLELAQGAKIVTIKYRLQRELDFDSERQARLTLMNCGIARLILVAVDPELAVRSDTEGKIRIIAGAAHELTQAFNTPKWLSLKQSNSLPAKSTLRLLGLTEHATKKLLEKAERLLQGENPARS